MSYFIAYLLPAYLADNIKPFRRWLESNVSTERQSAILAVWSWNVLDHTIHGPIGELPKRKNP